MRHTPITLAITGLLCVAAPAMGAEQKPSPNWAGSLGLNTVPSARMDKDGTVRLFLSALDPYASAGVSVQIAEPLNITMRQNAVVSSWMDTADRLHPSVDLKLRLFDEAAIRPEISIGMLSAYGNAQMAAEYIALSKRYNNFDFTAGLGWGRMATGGHFTNPLKTFGGHFKKKRNFLDENPNDPSNWFTGDRVGLFAGVEYFTPIDGLSIKADWGADDYSTEKLRDPGFKTPSPWSIGLHYQATPAIGMGVGVLGGEKIMANIHLSENLYQWPHKWIKSSPQDTSTITISSAHRGASGTWAELDAHGRLPIGTQIGRALRHITEKTPHGPADIYLTPHHYGLTGNTMRLVRRDVVNALSKEKNGSPAEIWHSMSMPASPPVDLETAPVDENVQSPKRKFLSWKFIIDNQTSLSEEGGGILYRGSLIQDTKLHIARPFVVGGGLRLNFGDSLHALTSQYLYITKPVRSDVPEFAGNLVALDRLYGSFTHSITTDTHVGFTAGYLEEMYAGFGGEILYRPFGKTFAVGAEAWNVWHRDPYTTMAAGLYKDSTVTGFINAWYEFPDTDLTAGVKVGRYLGQDFGVTASLDKHMDNGVRLSAFVTATNKADADIFGGTTHLYSGMRLSLPLGSRKWMMDGTEMRYTIAPLGRNAGQVLDTPMPLMEVSQPLSYRAITRSWTTLPD